MGLDHTLIDQPCQALRQDIGRHGRVAMDFVEAAQARKDRAQHQAGPAIAGDLSHLDHQTR